MSTQIETQSLTRIAELSGGEVIRGSGELQIRGITTDSRSVPPRSLFVALSGENFDGHNFIAAAAQAGATAALVDREVPSSVTFGLIKVSDTTAGLGALAGAWRAQFSPRVAAVTGTSGKTSCKEFLAAICRRRFRTIATEGNFNNHIGLPLTLFRIDSKTEKVVLEMGMSDRHEISYLAGLGAPQVGVITSVGPCHLDRLGNVEGVIEAKSELTEHLNGTNGTMILNRDGRYFDQLAEKVSCSLVTVGEGPEADLRLTGIESPGFQPASFEYCGMRVQLRTAGRHSVYNAALAAAAAEQLGVDRSDILQGLSEAFPARGRGNTIKIDGATVIDDAYNANPLSYSAALEMLSGTPANRRIVVLGDMLELGADAEKFHEKLGTEIAERRVDVLLHRGELASVAAENCNIGRKIPCETNEEIARELNNLLLPGDVVLVKASHGMRLDKVIGALAAGRRKTKSDVVRLAR